MAIEDFREQAPEFSLCEYDQYLQLPALELAIGKHLCQIELTEADKNQLQRFMQSDVEQVSNEPAPENLRLEDRIKRRKITAHRSTEKYLDLRFVRPSTACVERFFSVAKRAYGARESISPENF